MRTKLLISLLWIPMVGVQQAPPDAYDLLTIKEVEAPSKKLVQYKDVQALQAEVKEIGLMQDSALRVRAKTDRAAFDRINSDDYKKFLSDISE